MPAIPSGANAGSDLRGGAGVDSLLTALEGNAGRGREARVLLHRSSNTAAGAELDQRDYRHVCAGVRGRRHLLPDRWDRIWSAAWFGESAFLWEARQGTRSIRRATLGRGWLTPFCRSPEKAAPTGAMRPSP